MWERMRLESLTDEFAVLTWLVLITIYTTYISVTFLYNVKFKKNDGFKSIFFSFWFGGDR